MNRKDFFKALGLGVASIPFALSAKKKHEFTVLRCEDVIIPNKDFVPAGVAIDEEFNPIIDKKMIIDLARSLPEPYKMNTFKYRIKPKEDEFISYLINGA